MSDKYPVVKVAAVQAVSVFLEQNVAAVDIELSSD